MATCDYTPTTEVDHHASWARGGIAAGMVLRVTPDGLQGRARRSYCCHVHRDLGELGEIRAGGQQERELAADPLLADGQEAPS